MIIWFVVASVVAITLIFRSPAIDHRTVAAGALLPWLDAIFGGPRVLHSLTGAVAAMCLVMAVTRKRRLLRRRLLGIPIGLFCHLVLDGSFADTHAFWWPFFGWGFSEGQVPELENLGRSFLLEAVGIALGAWAWRTFRIGHPAARRRLLEDGRIDLPT